jgi:hypothetical protein
MSRLDPIEVARRFWSSCETMYPAAESTFPRRFDLWLPTGLPVSVERLPGLTPRRVAEWVERAGGALGASEDNRPVRGYLLARGGRGLIFVDAEDEEQELQFTLAHEGAHFLCHYYGPRLTMEARLGPAITEVLDGERPATPEELLAGVLRGCPIGQYQHLLSRGAGGSFLDPASQRAEVDADRVAFELMAPAKVARATSFRLYGNASRRNLTDVLSRDFQLPIWAANAYATMLFRPARSGEESWLGGMKRAITTIPERK